MPSRRLQAALLLLALPFLPASRCIIPPELTDTLGEAIETIEQQSEGWQQVLVDTREQLLNEGRQDLVADIDQIMTRATATVGVELRCNMDFAGERLQAFIGGQVAEALRNLQLRDQGQPEIESYKSPRTCNVSPEGTLLGDRIRDGDVADIVWYGYDFYQDSPDDARFQVVLRDQSSGAETDLGPRLALSSHYQMSLNLTGLDEQLAQDHLYQIVVRWDGTTFSQINVSPPTPVVVPLPACTWTASFSEEGSASERCPSGFVVTGLRCSGSYCDNLSLRCCPYQATADTAAAIGLSAPFSEEGSAQATVTNAWVSGATCSGKYCDNLVLHYLSTAKLSHTGQCSWSEWVSEEGSGERLCADGTYVAGMKCKGSYCDNMSLYCCGGRVN